ncbi:Lrp/AsnC family transcriptional regulator [Pseudemcibacter aquimaris]|uniref:Lrp/AsnC family transcriptional regulator n=1 Tax=Pseudemcibacter aquimaris TaxID=2857064 RepID=UPI0020110AA1|nr:Lrp/AsnC family transcriptional regulator [Pseudemcibacter aquimaris]MCC3862499.1 Lrp/AsnC family transcriptional regulator [Pseudemcibacter aquimaris]WDU57761.1 Lrp/AsnC family transcriptional regulator [Pseudemcibacter aquimaris]
MITDQDKKILGTLQNNGRMSMVDLAHEANMSESTCLRRTKSLEEVGVIKGYSANLDYEKAGFDVMAFVQVNINQNSEAEFDNFKNAVRASPYILECYSLSGPYDHLMKVVARNNKELSHFILKTLKTFPEIRDAQTLFVLHEVKHTNALPLDLP